MLHENFKDTDFESFRERRSVPNPETENSIFWVHQYKLLEGIDDYRFQVLALYDELVSTRQIIQQIGRVIRNPKRKQNQLGYFLDYSDGRQSRKWEEFLAFDNLVRQNGVEVVDFGAKIADSIRQTQPDVIFLEGRFRSSFDLHSLNPKTDLSIPKCANILYKPESFVIEQISDSIKIQYEREARDVRVIRIDKNTYCFLYLDFRNSQLLTDSYFIECKLAVSIMHELDNHVCFYDSLGCLPAVLKDNCNFVSVKDLRKLFSKAEGTKLTSVALHSSMIGPNSLRSKSFSSSNIEEVAPGFDDYLFVCNTATGNGNIGGSSTRRYVGFSRGRVSDLGIRVSLDDYLRWIGQISQKLDSITNSINSFERFATHSEIPSDPKPKHVLLDVTEIEDYFVSNLNSNEPLCVLDASCEIQNNKDFLVNFNGREYNGSIAFVKEKKKYQLTIDSVDDDFYSTDTSYAKGIVTHLNKYQSFRVIPNTVGSFFSHGEFYEPFIKFGKNYNDDQIGLLKVLYGCESLSSVASEKGDKIKNKSWTDNSIFYMVDSLGKHSINNLIPFDDPDILICDDMGTEAADFILADTNSRKRVVFIHCKGIPVGTDHGKLHKSRESGR